MLSKNVNNKKYPSKFVFFNEKNQKDSDNYWHRKLTLKVKFWHFLTARQSPLIQIQSPWNSLPLSVWHRVFLVWILISFFKLFILRNSYRMHWEFLLKTIEILPQSCHNPWFAEKGGPIPLENSQYASKILVAVNIEERLRDLIEKTCDN